MKILISDRKKWNRLTGEGNKKVRRAKKKYIFFKFEEEERLKKYRSYL